MSSSSGNGSPEQEIAAPRRKRGRSARRAQSQKGELAIAGVAWRPSGAGHALVVLGRGQGAGQMRSSFATLTVFHGGQTFPVTAPVTVTGGEGEADSFRQTLRFVFRLPASAPTWPIERMVLRWRGEEVELPPPAQPSDGPPGAESELFRQVTEPQRIPEDEAVTSEETARGEETVREETVREEQEVPVEASAEPEPPAAVIPPEPPVAGAEPEPKPQDRPPVVPQPEPGRYGPGISQAEYSLDSLREEVVAAKLELAQLHAEIAQTRLQYEEALMARDYAQRERNRAQQWLIDVTGELEDVERQLAECRRELDHVTRELAARRTALEEPEPETPAPAPPPGEGDGGPELDLNVALSALRSKLEGLLSDPPPTPDAAEFDSPPEEAPVQEAPFEEPGADMPPAAEALSPVPPVGEAPSPQAPQDEQPAMRTPASLPGQADREERDSSWFANALRRLAEEDPEEAGRLLVSLLPAQAIATPRTFHYDLAVRDDAVYAVDTHWLDTRVQRLAEPRPMDQTDAWIVGSLEQLGDLVVQRKTGFLRRLNRHGLKVKGQRARLDDLVALAVAPLRLRDLCAVGALIQPHLLLQMIVSSVDPTWVDGRPLSIRFDPREEDMRACTFRIQNGLPVVLGAEVTVAAGFGEPTTIAEGSARSLMRLLAGLPSPEDDQAEVTGPTEPLELLQSLVRRLELSSL